MGRRARYPSRKTKESLVFWPSQGRSRGRSKMKASLNSMVENMVQTVPKFVCTSQSDCRVDDRNTSRWPTYRPMILIILSFMRSFHHQLVLREWHIFDGIQRGRKIWILYYLSITMIIILIY